MLKLWEVLRVTSQGFMLRAEMPKEGSLTIPARELGTRMVRMLFLLHVCYALCFPTTVIMK